MKLPGWVALVAAIAGPLLAGSAETASEDMNKELEALRRSTLGDIFVLRDFTPGKLSFVESPDRHAGTWTHEGFRYVLADLKGSGSIRHIWTTQGKGDPYFVWEFYVDGEKTPSIRGHLEDLIEASQKVTDPVAPANYVAIDNRACNFYLPVPFEKSLRIEVVQQQPAFWLWFCQIDYRLDDNSLKGARLESSGEGGNLSLAYTGLDGKLKPMPPAAPREVVGFTPVDVAPGTEVSLGRLRGPAIVRELRLRWPEGAKLRLLARYDGAKSFAVDSPVAEFFGPFRGVSFFQHAPNDSSCYLPVPFRESCEFVLRNEGETAATASGSASLERVDSLPANAGYFHALHRMTDGTNGHRLHQVLYVRGRGQWLGMSLYHTGHDHGGGDFAVVDGEGANPRFLHGVNGEDYFTFAWFGKGAHHPYAVALTNDEGRYRHHFENVYPFKKSIAIEWGAFKDVHPESVAVWYQDSAEDTTVDDGARAEAVEWDVFGPVKIPFDESGKPTVADPFSVLPSVADLDAGKQFECVLVKEKFMSGWQKELSVGPALNLTYLARHGTRVDPEVELGGMGHASIARRFLESDKEQTVRCLFAHDDPVQVLVNGRLIYEGPQHFNGFESNWIELPLRAGRNEVVVRLTSYFNRDFNWNGFLFRPEMP